MACEARGAKADELWSEPMPIWVRWPAMRHFVTFLVIIFAGVQAAEAQQIEVKTAPAPPLLEEAAEGRWTGPAADLVRQAANEAGMTVIFESSSHSELEAGMRRGTASAVLATGDVPQNGYIRSLPLHVDAIGVTGMSAGLVRTLQNLFTPAFAWIAFSLSILLLVVGTIMWLVERRRTEDFQKDNALQGVGQGFWWAGVTMTTIGYGDTVPRTKFGRAVALLWMLISMALTASLTAALVSAGQAGGGSGDVSELLEGERVGVVERSAAAAYLQAAGTQTRSYPTLEAALAAEDADEIDTVAAPYQQLKAHRGGRSVRKTSAAVLPLHLYARDPALIEVADDVVLSPAWSERLNQALSN